MKTKSETYIIILATIFFKKLPQKFKFKMAVKWLLQKNLNFKVLKQFWKTF